MDAPRARTYVAEKVNMLLLLSALLSALTGLGTGVREVAPAPAVATHMANPTPVARMTPKAVRVLDLPPATAVLARAHVAVAAAPPACAPLYLLRRRE